MITLELDDETAGLLEQLANREHKDASQLIKKALAEYLAKPSSPTEEPALMTDIIATLPPLPTFAGEPLQIQKAMRDDWD